MQQSVVGETGDKYRHAGRSAQTGPAGTGTRWLARRALAGALLATVVARSAPAQEVEGPLVVFNAGSLALPVRDLLRAFQREHPGVRPRQENSGSLEAARKLTELGKVPDVIAVADYQVLEKVLLPRQATWYATFARNAMVLAYTDRSLGAATVDSTNWYEVLLRPGVRTGHSDPALDPNGYRTLLVLQLAERHYRQPGLARRLDSAMPPRYQRPKEADLTALLQAGELDYAWSYRSLALTAGLRQVSLPRAIDLSDPAREAEYARATVRVPGARGDTLEFRGESILYALTIPVAAPHPAAGLAFVRFVLSPAGRAILERHGFIVPAAPGIVGTGAPGLR